MEEHSSSAAPATSAGARSTSSSRRYVSIPDLARRGRTTLRHFILLLVGGFVAWVDADRERGKRGLLLRLRSALAWMLRPLLGREFANEPFPVQLRRRLELLGPTYIKLGQILSLRLDVLPETVTEELRNLLSRLPPVPFVAIVKVVEEDLDQPLDALFAEVDPQPIGSASIAQIHRARLPTGERVLLKVVKPGIPELLDRDTTLLRMLAVVLQPLLPHYQPRRIIGEFCSYTLREIDMGLEARNAETFAANFRDNDGIVFPTPYHAYSGKRVLCMEYLQGEEVTSAVVQGLSRDVRERLVDLGAEAVIRMVYEDGFFHADLHPGNLLILPGNRVGFVDLGMVGQLEPGLRDTLLYLFNALVTEDFDSAARHLAEVAEVGPSSNVAGFRSQVKDLCRRWRRDASFETFSLAMLILEAIRMGVRYELYFPVEMVLMVKALVTYEGVGYMLDKDFNVIEVSRRHLGRIFRHRFSPRRLLREGVRLAPDLLDAVSRMPLLVSEGLRYLEQRTRRVPTSPLRGTRATLFGGFCLVSAAILAAFNGPWPLWVALLVIGLLLPLRRD
jgi:ubiquinone biosynthesis protein